MDKTDQSPTQPNFNRPLDKSQVDLNRVSDESLLGNTTEFASTPVNINLPDDLRKKLENNESRYTLQKIAQSYHPHERLNACMKTLSPDAEHVELHYHDETQHAHYRNLMRCDDVWRCPVCSARITSNRAEQIRQAYSNAVTIHGFVVVMVTYTMSHRVWDSLEKNITDLRQARRKMRSGRKWQNFKRNYGYIGCISSLEVPYNAKNGWHVHVHELMVLDPQTAEYDLLAGKNESDQTYSNRLEKWLDLELKQWWIDSLDKLGRTASKANGLKVNATDQYVAEYISKYGHLPQGETWDAALEITKFASKIDTTSIHAFQILELSANDSLEDHHQKRMKALWFEYAAAMKGKAQIYWTTGLKELLLVADLPDEEDSQTESDMVMFIGRSVWRDVLYMKQRGGLLNQAIVTRGDPNAINRWLKQLSDKCARKRKQDNHWRSLYERGKRHGTN